MSGFNPFPDEDDEPSGETPEELSELLERQKNLLIAVAQHDLKIQDVEAEHTARRQKLLVGLKRYGYEYPFPWRGLWEWHAKWSSDATLPSYASRRKYIADLANPVYDGLEQLTLGAAVTDWHADDAPASWAALEARLENLKIRMNGASNLDDLQDVGRRAREIIKDAVNMVFHDEMVPSGEEAPKTDDAKARLGYILTDRFSGQAREELRSVLKSSLRLAHKITHSSAVSELDAFVGAQATVVVVRTLQRLAPGPRNDRHDPKVPPPPWDWDDLGPETPPADDGPYAQLRPRPPPPTDADAPPPEPLSPADEDVPF